MSTLARRAAARWPVLSGMREAIGMGLSALVAYKMRAGLTILGVVMGILILSTQRRADQLAELREQMTLELASVTERKVAKVIELIEELRRDSPTLKNRTDQEARQMSVRTTPGEVLIAIKDSHEEMTARSTDAADAAE